MKKTTHNLILLAMLFVVSLVISNVVTAKTIQTNIPLFGTTIIVPGAVLCYAITFLITDIVGEVWGKEEANTIVKYGFIGQVLATLLIVVTQFLPATDDNMQNSYEMLLGQNIIFVIGSLTGYLISQSWDVWIFHKTRERFIKMEGNNKKRWIWNNLSTMTSQILDTIIFIIIAFGIGYGWLFQKEMWSTLGGMIIGQYFIKFILALIDTPFFYFFTKDENKKNFEE